MYEFIDTAQLKRALIEEKSRSKFLLTQFDLRQAKQTATLSCSCLQEAFDTAASCLGVPVGAWQKVTVYECAQSKNKQRFLISHDALAGFYLFAFDAAGRSIRDDLCDSFQDAILQAQEQFGVSPQAWQHKAVEEVQGINVRDVLYGST